MLAGMAGQVGRRVHRLLVAAGHEVRGVSGRAVDLTQPQAAYGLAQGCGILVSCAGASVSIWRGERRSFEDVDPVIHAALLEEAVRARVYRFVYLGVHLEGRAAHTHFVRAHERFVSLLRTAPLSATVIRPTRMFSSFQDLVPLARCGVMPLSGDGQARMNPIDPQDVADLLLRHLHAGPADVDCGGPEVLTREEIYRVIAESHGKKVWMPRVPAGLVRTPAGLLRPFHPRVADLLEFFHFAAAQDCIAPVMGQRRLKDYWRSC